MEKEMFKGVVELSGVECLRKLNFSGVLSKLLWGITWSFVFELALYHF
jgi:hypothetical protein